MKLLIKYEAHVNATDDENKSPLHYAAEKGHKEAIEYLIKYKARVNAKDDLNKTSLQYATDNGHNNIVTYLKKKQRLSDQLIGPKIDYHIIKRS
ncbi:GA-binding protein subunit beta-1-like [Contarinia nasturtii]|uniref:GA-binding protein subunit beta-1-like n=1 Tax=Contarinia nasturtii TaxID=265458 RepID=UPI0012D3DF3E|nr:GA-binding protein subunit beta-1-like [Contarinia nasturtii]